MMKKLLYTALLLMMSVSIFAQDQKATLDKYYKYASHEIKDIMGTKAGESNGYEIFNTTENPSLGQTNIAMIDGKPVIVWKTPLSQAKDLIATTEEFIKKNYGGFFAARYMMETKESEDKTYKMTTVSRYNKDTVFIAVTTNLPDSAQNTYTIFFYPDKD